MESDAPEICGYSLTRESAWSHYESRHRATVYMRVHSLRLLSENSRASIDAERSKEGKPPLPPRAFEAGWSFDLRWHEYQDWQEKRFTGPYIGGHIDVSEHAVYSKIRSFLSGSKLLEKTLGRVAVSTGRAAEDVGDWLIDDPYYLVNFFDKVGAPRVERLPGGMFVEQEGSRKRLESEGLARMMVSSLKSTGRWRG